MPWVPCQFLTLVYISFRFLSLLSLLFSRKLLEVITFLKIDFFFFYFWCDFVRVVQWWVCSLLFEFFKLAGGNRLYHFELYDTLISSLFEFSWGRYILSSYGSLFFFKWHKILLLCCIFPEKCYYLLKLTNSRWFYRFLHVIVFSDS